MSELILPGSEAYTTSIESIDLTKPKNNNVLGEVVNLEGRTVMLNTARIKTFQCGGLALGFRRPFAIIDHRVQQEPVRRALSEGILLDVTDQDMTKGFKHEGGETTAIAEEDTGLRVYMGKDDVGNVYLVTPKDAEQKEQFEKEIIEFGFIRSVEFEQPTGISSIAEEDLLFFEEEVEVS